MTEMAIQNTKICNEIFSSEIILCILCLKSILLTMILNVDGRLPEEKEKVVNAYWEESGLVFQLHLKSNTKQQILQRSKARLVRKNAQGWSLVKYAAVRSSCY